MSHITNDFEHALSLLRTALSNRSAKFRPGQWECVEKLWKRRKKLLVVQRTGWGKSMLYFLTTRLLRNEGSGPTLLISPLLALMRNQIMAAEGLHLQADTINSDNTELWQEVRENILSGRTDILLISPERLANEDFRTSVLIPMAARIGLFVVDEAHCISDWGHDFRPDYKRIAYVLRSLPSNIPVLATTATANNRVVDDIANQLQNFEIIRGPLIRESLRLQNIFLPTHSERLAWLVENLPRMPGSGIIYTLTIRDAERVANYLQTNNINALAYHSNSENRSELESKLLNNEVKALVATVALGMGFDKPDLGFVIHYQRPGSIVHYYQQVGRAGRAIANAYGILMNGAEDEDITSHFIESAFPPHAHVTEVLSALEQADDGLSVPMMQRELNLKFGAIQKVLHLLSVEHPSPVIKEKSRWYRTPIPYHMDTERIKALCRLRREEQAVMRQYMQSSQCLMQFISNSLDDPHAAACGKCAPCLGRPILPEHVSPEHVNKASIFLRRSHQVIEPRRMWPPGYEFQSTGWKGRIATELKHEEGRALCLYGDAGWGKLVQAGKYKYNHFDDRLVEGCVELLNSWSPSPSPQWVTCVPSLKHPDLVPNFASRLADRLGLPFAPCIVKLKQNQQQKSMQNSHQQVMNLDGAFGINSQLNKEPVLLIDDMIDSRWTITVVAALLRENGSGTVFPLALALNSLQR